MFSLPPLYFKAKKNNRKDNMLFSVKQAFMGRDEIRAPPKTPAWEAVTARAEAKNEC